MEHAAAADDRKARKSAKAALCSAGKWNRCMEFLAKKGRHCNMERAPGSLYCGAHAKDCSEDRKGDRVPCPIDPSHTVWRKTLEAHLKVCNSAAVQNRLAQQPFYTENVNSGTDACRIAEIEASVVDPVVLVSKIRAAFENVGHIDDVFLTASEALRGTVFDELIREKHAFRREKHGLQASSLVAHLERRGLLSNECTYVEFGAGRAFLGLAIKCAAPHAQLVCVERAGVRAKADKKMRDEETAGRFTRARVDIRHLNMRGLSLHKSGVTAVAKHLCGVATDLALRSLLTLQKAHVVAGTQESVECAAAYSLLGVCFATCCHHACVWEDYADLEWLREQGFLLAEFNVMKRWSSWATLVNDGLAKRMDEKHAQAQIQDKLSEDCALSHSTQQWENLAEDKERNDGESRKRLLEENEEGSSDGTRKQPRVLLQTDEQVTHVGGETALKLSLHDKIEVGRMIKRVLDYGRVRYLRTMGLAAEIVHYCDTRTSPENALLIAWNPK